MDEKRVGRPKAKDKRIAVTFMAYASKVKEAKKKKGLNKFLEQSLYDYLSR